MLKFGAISPVVVQWLWYGVFQQFGRLLMITSMHSMRSLFALSLGALLVGCASTQATLQPSPQAPVCAASATALILWAPHWRPDQKDVLDREEAAAAGLTEFFAKSGCFALSELRRVNDFTPQTVQKQVGSIHDPATRFVGVEVRELGPTVKLLSSAALVEGGTEVVLRVIVYSPLSGVEERQFTVHWHHGGPGVVKGIASLPSDMQAALRAGLQPDSATK